MAPLEAKDRKPAEKTLAETMARDMAEEEMLREHTIPLTACSFVRRANWVTPAGRPFKGEKIADLDLAGLKLIRIEINEEDQGSTYWLPLAVDKIDEFFALTADGCPYYYNEERQRLATISEEVVLQREPMEKNARFPLTRGVEQSQELSVDQDDEIRVVGPGPGRVEWQNISDDGRRQITATVFELENMDLALLREARDGLTKMLQDNQTLIDNTPSNETS